MRAEEPIQPADRCLQRLLHCEQATRPFLVPGSPETAYQGPEPACDVREGGGERGDFGVGRADHLGSDGALGGDPHGVAGGRHPPTLACGGAGYDAAVLRLIDLRGCSDPAASLPRPKRPEEMPQDAVREIIAAVRAEGDVALRRLTRAYDRVEIDAIRVDPETVKRSREAVAPELWDALSAAAGRIEAYQLQRARTMGIGDLVSSSGSPSGSGRTDSHQEGTAFFPDLFARDGIAVATRRAPVSRAGLYVPGGRAKYPSTVLMTAILARVAGVEGIALCVPPGPDGDPPVETLAAAAIAGVDEVYRVGGAQAIAAMAYGTESVPRVDVIAGPGNVYVSVAKQEVAGVVGVPGAFAGPSEVVVVADGSTAPELAAIDLAVQAEHGPDGLAWLVTWSLECAEAVGAALDEVVATSPRRDDLEATLAAGGYTALVDGPSEAIQVVDLIAPEHLELLVAGAGEMARRVRNAGVIFCGAMAPASVGDYLAGPSHVLPTNGTARFAGALSVIDFTKEMSMVSVDRDTFGRTAGVVATIATAEGLDAHAQSVLRRRDRA